MTPYRITDHTADLAIEVQGRNFPELVLHAAQGLIALLLGDAAPEATDTRLVRAAGPTRERALVHALADMLAMIEDEGEVPVSPRLADPNSDPPELAVGVVPLDVARPYLGAEIKAVTYHGLDIREERGLLSCQIVFDV